MESMIGRLWALEDAARRLVAAVRKSAMHDAADIEDDGSIRIRSEMETAVKRWRARSTWQAKHHKRMFLATYEYWIREERQRRARAVWICSSGEQQEDDRGGLQEALYKSVRHNDEENFLGRFGRAMTMMKATAYWRKRELSRRLIQFKGWG